MEDLAEKCSAAEDLGRRDLDERRKAGVDDMNLLDLDLDGSETYAE